jgi:hypothetical protein
MKPVMKNIPELLTEISLWLKVGLDGANPLAVGGYHRYLLESAYFRQFGWHRGKFKPFVPTFEDERLFILPNCTTY